MAITICASVAGKGNKGNTFLILQTQILPITYLCVMAIGFFNIVKLQHTCSRGLAHLLLKCPQFRHTLSPKRDCSGQFSEFPLQLEPLGRLETHWQSHCWCNCHSLRPVVGVGLHSLFSKERTIKLVRLMFFNTGVRSPCGGHLKSKWDLLKCLGVKKSKIFLRVIFVGCRFCRFNITV